MTKEMSSTETLTNQPRLVYQVQLGRYPNTQILYEAKTRDEAFDWCLNNAPGLSTKITTIHYVWSQGAWRKINSSVMSKDCNKYRDFQISQLRQG